MMPKVMKVSMTNFSKKWDSLEADGYHAGRFRVFPDSPLDLFIGYSISGEREFTLESRGTGIDELNLPSFEHISLESHHLAVCKRIVLRLTDKSLTELFVVICADLAEASSAAKTEPGALQIFALRLERWSRLLRRMANNGMSFAEQLGLLGELSVLLWLIEDVRLNPKVVIRGWRGADGDDSDIGINGLSIEVKAQLATQTPALKISSLEQLATEGRKLYLIHCQFSSAETGISLACMIRKISDYIDGMPEAQAEFRRKLYLLSYDCDASYATNQYIRELWQVYSVSTDFPVLTSSNVPAGICNVRYEIKCESIEKFKCGLDEIGSELDGKS